MTGVYDVRVTVDHRVDDGRNFVSALCSPGFESPASAKCSQRGCHAFLAFIITPHREGRVFHDPLLLIKGRPRISLGTMPGSLPVSRWFMLQEMVRRPWLCRSSNFGVSMQRRELRCVGIHRDMSSPANNTNCDDRLGSRSLPSTHRIFAVQNLDKISLENG